MTPIPPPQGLPPPPRQIRTLRRTAQFLAIGIAVVIIGIVYYGLTHMGPGEPNTPVLPPPGSSESVAADVLRNAPPGNEIKQRLPRPDPPKVDTNASPVAFNLPQSPPPFNSWQPPASKQIQAVPPDDMTETAIAARRAAWQAYYQALTDIQQHRLETRRAAMGSDIEPPVSVPGSAPGGASVNVAPEQHKPVDFFAANASRPDTDYSPWTVTNPISPYELKAADIITAKLVSGMNSDSPGIIKALVTKTVTDHATGMHILIPQGSTLVGVYDTAIAYGQTRQVSAWQQIIYPPPCDQTLDLGAMPGSDQSGQAGFEDLTDNHLGKVFTAAILVSVFGAAVQLSQPPQSAFSTYSPVQSAGGAVGQQMASLGQEFARKGMSIPPTERVREGYPFTVMLTKAIAFDHPWIDGVCEENKVTAE